MQEEEEEEEFCNMNFQSFQKKKNYFISSRKGLGKTFFFFFFLLIRGASTGRRNQFKIIWHLQLLWELPLEDAKENIFRTGSGKHWKEVAQQGCGVSIQNSTKQDNEQPDLMLEVVLLWAGAQTGWCPEVPSGVSSSMSLLFWGLPQKLLISSTLAPQFSTDPCAQDHTLLPAQTCQPINGPLLISKTK